MAATFVPEVEYCAICYPPAYSEEFNLVSYNLKEWQMSIMIIKIHTKKLALLKLCLQTTDLLASPKQKQKWDTEKVCTL